MNTVDFDAVEILSVGGPVHGRGSVAGGDFYGRADLRAIAAANRDLAGELKPPAKIGHAGDAPAVGWLENIRVNETGDKLLADVRRMPKGVASLIDVGAYRTRSVELSKVTSQVSGRTYELAVTGLAWLGGKMPAVRTLDDVVKLYETDSDVDALKAEILALNAGDPLAEQRARFGDAAVETFVEADMRARLRLAPGERLL